MIYPYYHDWLFYQGLDFNETKDETYGYFLNMCWITWLDLARLFYDVANVVCG